jgi:ribosomal protein S18 acetylase RimI-like enzyme
VTQDLIIREATLADAADVATVLTELNETVGAVGYPPDEEKLPQNTHVSVVQAESRMRGIQGIETILLAYMEGELAGFASLRVIPYLDQDTPYAELTQLHVRPAFRRRGIATQLVTRAQELAVSKDATAVHILCAVENLDGQAFYRAAGYEVVCVEFDKYFERAAVHA